MQRTITGIEVDDPGAEEVFNTTTSPTRLVGQVSAPEGLGYAAAYRRESALAGGVTKATVVSPMEMTVHATDQRNALMDQDGQPPVADR